MHDADFPYDVQWTDIDAMSSFLDFTFDDENFRGLPELAQALQSRGQHYVNVFDAGISSTQPADTYPPYDEGRKRNVFIKKFGSDEPIIGTVKPKWRLPLNNGMRLSSLQMEAGQVAYPDFTNPVTAKWWSDMIQAFHEKIPFDGVCLVSVIHSFWHLSIAIY